MEKLLDVDEVSEILGVTRATIYSWTCRNKIPHIKLSKRLLKFRETEIINWIEEKAVNSPGAPESNPDAGRRRTTTRTNVHDEQIERIIKRAKEAVLN